MPNIKHLRHSIISKKRYGKHVILKFVHSKSMLVWQTLWKIIKLNSDYVSKSN